MLLRTLKQVFSFGLWRGNPIQEYNLIGELKFYERRLEQEPLVVFTFVVFFSELGLDK